MTGHKTFGARMVEAMGSHGPLCVGLDPHASLLEQWGLPDNAEGVRRFTDTVLEAVAGRVAAVKPQSAFYERHGAAGVQVLEDALVRLRESGTLSVLDVKRGDIGSTLAAYAEAYLADGAPMVADSVTLSPYLGYGALRPAIDLAARTGRGVFVLTLTSNPEGADVQHQGDPCVAGRIAQAAAQDNAGADPVGHVGLVIGATVGRRAVELGIDLVGVNGILLAPGIGAQGARPADLSGAFEGARGRVLAPVSRELLAAGPTVAGLRDAADRLTHELSVELED